MALIKCGECGSEISDKAAACPKCGAPVPKAPPPKPKNDSGRALLIVLGAVAVGICIAWVGSKDEQPQAAAKVEAPCAASDLSCRGNKGVSAASVYCKDPIERLAKHSMRWMDGTFDMKMTRFRWTAKPEGTLTYVGDKAEFQNGFGAYTRMIYECELADDLKTVLNVRVREGRLPAS